MKPMSQQNTTITRRRKKGSRRRARWITGILFFAVVVLFSGLFYFNQVGKPVDPTNKREISVNIPAGSSTGQIAEILADQSLIQSVLAFKLSSRIEGYDGRFQAGDYLFSRSMSMKDLMELLLVGRGKTVRFTIPEGYDLEKITQRLADEGLIDAAVFRQELETGAFDYPFMAQVPAGPNRLEGYLFPETYDVYAQASEHEIIDRMLAQFHKVMTEEGLYDRAEELHLPLQDVIIMASVVEREAMVAADRPIIAGVFYNRLRIGMPLQSCATIQFILGEQKPRLTIKDTQTPSPYNTYLYPGLPPGPIASPGLASLRAALYPADTEYLYFLAKGDGSHVFSKTYDEFLAHKAQYID